MSKEDALDLLAIVLAVSVTLILVGGCLYMYGSMVIDALRGSNYARIGLAVMIIFWATPWAAGRVLRLYLRRRGAK